MKQNVTDLGFGRPCEANSKTVLSYLWAQDNKFKLAYTVKLLWSIYITKQYFPGESRRELYMCILFLPNKFVLPSWNWISLDCLTYMCLNTFLYKTEHSRGLPINTGLDYGDRDSIAMTHFCFVVGHSIGCHIQFPSA